MRRCIVAIPPLLVLALPAGPSRAQSPSPAPASSPASAADSLLRALAADPITAPYVFTTRMDRGRVVLSGRVGTKAVYDRAVRIAIATGIPFTDRLVIDTAELARAVPGRTTPLPAAPPYVYPQPLMGYLDEPFYGFEPPLVSLPPWWPPRANGSTMPPAAGPPPPPTPLVTGTGQRSVELSIDPLGYGVLRGRVATQVEKDELAARAARLEGVQGIINKLEVEGEGEGQDQDQDQAAAGDPAAVPPPPKPMLEDQPPPPPQPYDPARDRPGDAPAAPGASLEQRVNAAVQAVAGNGGGDGIRATAAGTTVTLSGKAPDALAALRAFRAAQQAPGVESVVDRIEFPVPVGGARNPLLDAAPGDLQAYLLYHLSRQLGASAPIEAVEVQGRTVRIRVRVDRPELRGRAEAVLRSSPLLRGFQLDPAIQSR